MKLFVLAFVLVALASLSVGVRAVELFDLRDVRLLDGPFKHAQDLNVEQLLQYDADRLLAPFRIDAGLEPKAPRYPNWESSGLDGHTGGHYLSALAIHYAATGDERLRERLDYAVAELAACQEAHGNGYVGGIPDSRPVWDAVADGRIDASGFGLNGRWVPLYNLHKTFAGLRDAYVVAGNEQARDVLTKLTDWLGRTVADLSDEQLQDMLRSEHGGLNETLADVAAITGEDRYLDLARRFNHHAILDPLVAHEDRLNGLHANTQVPKVVGFQRIANLDDDQQLHAASLHFWDIVVHGRSLAFGGNSINEHFPAPHQSIDWMRERAGPESCNTYNMLRLTEQLFLAQPEAELADFYERAALNHILSTQHPEHGGYVYFTTARPRHYRNYSQVGQAFWCCVGSGMENHGKYGQFIYAHDDDTLYVNLFIASEVNWKEHGVTVKQENRFPDEARTKLTLNMESPKDFALKLRHPAWVESGAFRVTINGEAVDSDSTPASYAVIERTWNDGDVIEVELPMTPRLEPLPHLDDYAAVMYGPVLLAAPTGTDDMPDLLAGDGRMEHIAHGALRPLDESPALVANSDDDVLADLERVSSDDLTFRIDDVLLPETYESLELIPFFRLHDQRYVMYWRVATPEEYQSTLDAERAGEEQRLALERRTVDQLTPGQQQPESDHNFRGENTTTGVWQDRSYRHADGWFAYDLKSDGSRDLKLRVTYFGSDHRRFNIAIDDRVIERVNLAAPRPGEFMDVEYDIPARLLPRRAGETLRVTFTAQPGSMAGGLFDVRLVQPETEP